MRGALTRGPAGVDTRGEGAAGAAPIDSTVREMAGTLAAALASAAFAALAAALASGVPRAADRSTGGATLPNSSGRGAEAATTTAVAGCSAG